MIAGGTMDQVADEVEPRRAAAAAAGAGVVGAALGGLGARAAQRLGVLDAESAIAGGVVQVAGEAPGLARRVAGGALTEGVLEELPQSAAETVIQNWAEEKELTEGLARAAVEGTLAGSAMGAGVNVIPPRKRSQEMGLDPAAGALSAAAVVAVDSEQARLPAPERLALPAPEQAFYADGQGNVSEQGPARDVDREQRPTGRERAPQTFGAGMEQQAERGAQPGREGDYIPASRSAEQPRIGNTFEGQLAPEPVGLPAPQRRLADGRPDAGFIETNAFGESRQVKASNVPPENYVPQGGRGMDQPTPFGQKYSNPMQARNAIQKAGAAATHEAVQVGPKQFEVRAKQPEVAPAIQFAAGQQWTHAGRLYKVQADGRAHVSTPSPMPSRT